MPASVELQAVLFNQNQNLINNIFQIRMKQEVKQDQFQINKKVSFQPCFQENASFLSRAFFVWSHEIIRRGNEKHLDMEDLSDLKDSEDPRKDYEGFEKSFIAIGDVKKNKLIKTFQYYFGTTFLLAGTLATIANLLQFSGPLMIQRILEFLNSSETNPQPLSNGITYVCILIGCYLLRTIIFGHSMHFVNLCCTKVMNSANSKVFHKILSLSSASRKYLDVGSIMTHINVDIMSFYYFIMMSTFVFSAPIMVVTAMVLLILEVGWIGLVAPILFGFGMVIQNKITKKGFELRKDQLFWTDKRTKCVNEYFSGIRIIKYYGWQKLVADKIEEIRNEEIKLGFKALIYRTYIEVIMNMLPIFASIIIFGVYSALYGQDKLTSSKVYTVLSIFNLISVPMRLLIMTVINFINAKASMDRVNHFFGYEEKCYDGLNEDDPELQVGDIQYKNCIFQWESEEVKKHHKEGEALRMKKGGGPPAPKKPEKNEEAEKKPEKKKKKKKVPKDGEAPKPKKKKKGTKKKSNIGSSENMLNESLLSQKEKSRDSSSVASSNRLQNLEIPKLNIHRGQFVSVIGRVGSGKTTFLYSILGQIDKVQGTLSRRGTIAYIPQTSWLRSSTIRDNILFETPYDESRYNHILKICELESDLDILPGGDLTQIGEKGVNLSGGQKQRISIARALYADADIYLIDDCLSALDPYVGKNIFYHCLKEYLHEKGKTIVFVTNTVHFTEETDRVIVIDRGRIIEDDVPVSLKKKSSIFENLMLQEKKSQQAEEIKKIELERKKTEEKEKKEEDLQIKLDDEEVTQDTKKEKDVSGLVKVEERLRGSVPWIFYYRFFTGPGGIKAVLMFLFITLAQLSRVFSDWWLGEWGSDSLQMPSNTYIIVYACISIVVGALIYLKGYFFARFIVATSRVIQRLLIKTLLKTPLSWFDVTPTGRIISRTTKDQDDLDSNLAFNVQFSTQNILILLSSIVIISAATPLYLIVAVLSGIAYYRLIGLYMNSSREIKRLEANSRAPLLGHISETINGTYVVRAFDKTEKFIEKYYMRQKSYVVCIVNQNICNRWINIVTDLFSVLTIAATGFFGVISVAENLGKSSNNMVGLALVWSLQINGIMSFTLRLLADTESCMNSVVRLYEYIDNNPSEKSFDEQVPKAEVWPTAGNYAIEDVSYRYRPELPLVLKKISFDIKSKEKIGVVGRTGSGKSTLTLGLLRILELAENDDTTTGKIVLDDEDISELGLHHLRQNVTIIPQDPTLFTGTIKTNIDPFNRYTDEEIADTLRKVSLWDQIREDPDETTEVRKKVYSKVDDSGSNFSLGQKQLICMARALIRKPKVLLMDEATASIDEKTDELIQHMIRTQFKDTTVITIAHRLNTIMYYDKILVLERGEVKEYDKPLTLVRDENTFLGKLIRKTGERYMQKIMALAQKSEREKLE